MSPGLLTFLSHTQEVIHCMFHCTLAPPTHLNSTFTTSERFGTQQRLSLHPPQYRGWYFLLLVQPDRRNHSAVRAWKSGLQDFPGGIWAESQILH